MKNSIALIQTSILTLCLSAGAIADGPGSGESYVFGLQGTAIGVPTMVPAPEGGQMEAICWEFDLIDVANQRALGKVSDCATITNIIGDVEFVTAIGTTTFYLPQGSVTTQGLTTVAQVQQATESPVIGPITHFTTSYSPENAIISGTKAFKNATGMARLAGLGNFQNVFVNGELSVDCIFVLNID